MTAEHEGSQQHRRSATLLSLAILLHLGAVGAVSLNTELPKYVILIDAGSTGSRIHVFAIEHSATGLPKVAPSISTKVKPGLSSFASDPKLAAGSIRGLLEFAEKQIERSHWHRTPVHLMATAGLRMLPPNEAESILDSVSTELERSSFAFRREWARVISGVDEGLNGWVAANYLLGIFDQPNPSPLNTKGIIEMGGASVQVTFAPKEPLTIERIFAHSVTIQSNTFYVYTHSYLNYGLEKAQVLLQQKLMDEIEEQGNPCYLKGQKHSATGNYKQCANMVGRLLLQEKCSWSHCSFNDVYQPPITDERFLAIENFFWVSEFFGIAPDDPNFLRDLEAKAEKWCASSWDQVVDEVLTSHAKETKESVKRYCFGAAYLKQFLTQGLKLSPEMVASRVSIAHEIAGRPVDWALGAVVRMITAHDPTLLFASDHSLGLSEVLVGASDKTEESRGPRRGGLMARPVAMLGLAVMAVAGWFLHRRLARRPPKQAERTPANPTRRANTQRNFIDV